jgi:hypothetical protein
MKGGTHMRSDESVSGSATVILSPAISFPIALYESNGLIFELYQGGQKYQAAVIRWERLKTVTITRQDNSALNLHIHQGQRVPDQRD